MLVWACVRAGPKCHYEWGRGALVCTHRRSRGHACPACHVMCPARGRSNLQAIYSQLYATVNCKGDYAVW
jgi:hypothetical protein